MDFPPLQNDQHAVITVEVNTGIVLRHDGQRFLGSGETWRIFDSLTAAQEFSKAHVAVHPSNECNIYNAHQQHVEVVRK